MGIGVGQIVAQVIEKPEVRTSNNKQYHTIVIADVGWKARFNCSPEVYHQTVAKDGRMLVFTGSMDPVRATRSGGNFADDYIALTLEKVKEYVPPAAPPAAKS